MSLVAEAFLFGFAMVAACAALAGVGTWLIVKAAEKI